MLSSSNGKFLVPNIKLRADYFYARRCLRVRHQLNEFDRCSRFIEGALQFRLNFNKNLAHFSTEINYQIRLVSFKHAHLFQSKNINNNTNVQCPNVGNSNFTNQSNTQK